MQITLRPLQAITNAPECYDYGWMHTLVENIAVDDRGRSYRLVENDDEWHFEQQLLRYGSGLHLAITDQQQLDDYLRNGWLRLTDAPIPIHRFAVDLSQAIEWEDDRRGSLLECLNQWRHCPNIKYRSGQRCKYYFECRGDEAAETVRSAMRQFGFVG